MKHNEQCFKNQALRDLGVGGPLASCTCGLDALLRVARAARVLADADGSMRYIIRHGDYYVVAWHVIESILIQLKEVEHLLI